MGDVDNVAAARIIFDQVVENDNNVYSTSNGGLTLPAGVWLINVNMAPLGNPNPDNSVSLMLYKNGSLFKNSPTARAGYYGANSPVGVTLTAIVRSGGSDVFTVYVSDSNGNGANINVEGGSNSNLDAGVHDRQMRRNYGDNYGDSALNVY